MKKFAKWLDSGGMGGDGSDAGGQDRQTGRGEERRGKTVLSAPGRERWQEGGK